MQKFQLPFCEEYSHSLEFKTSVVRRFNGSEQRQALWMNPKRTFELNIESQSASKTALEEFFRARRGDYEKFLWTWDEAYSGSGLDYTCFFDSPKLAQNVFPLSYSKTALTLVTIDDGNILKDRFFTRTGFWQSTGNVVFEEQKATYSGGSTLFQNNVMEIGQFYRLNVKTQVITGLAPVLSVESSSLPAEQRQLAEGDNTIDFIAYGANLKFETPEATAGDFVEISLIKRPSPAPVFDFGYREEHQSEIHFITIKDEEFTWRNARYSVRENPLRRWVLVLELSPSEALRFDAFFAGQKGRYRTFSWNYGGEALNVRFDTDKLEQKQFPLGYREVKVPVIEVAESGRG